MKRHYCNKLLKISSSSIGPDIGAFSFDGSKPRLFHELLKILSIKNGFYAFESALLFRAIKQDGRPIGLKAWNENSMWFETYKLNLPELFFFAEDIFGGQFAICDNEIIYFDPETGEIERLCDSFEKLAAIILKDYDYRTGFSLANKWQQKFGPLPFGKRLIPKKLFVLGGDFVIDNLMAVDEIKGMRIRGGIATNIANIPDGTIIEFEYID